MAEGKKGVIVYADWIDKFEELEDDEAGRLIKHFFRYINDLNPEYPDRTTKLMFLDIQKSLKRDLDKWESEKKQRSDSGRMGNLKRWNPDLFDKVSNGFISLDVAESIAMGRKESQSDGCDKTSSPPIANIAVNGNSNSNSYITTTKSDIDDLIFLCLGNTDWVLEIERMYKIDRAKIHLALNEFKSHRITIGKDGKECLKDFKSHFTNWVRKKKEYHKIQ